MDAQTDGAFAGLLREHRLAAGLTQEALAERAGLGVRSIQALERGESRPLRDSARRLADALALGDGERARLLAAGSPAPRRPSDGGTAVPAPPSAAPRHNLPRALTGLVGREGERAEVLALLAEARLVTLTGTGGVGKTRLALAVAAETVGLYPDGVWLVELAALAEPSLVPAAAAQALGVREEPGRPLAATLTDYLKDRHTLLVLDNCEHLVAACADLASGLLRSCPLLRILATSREGLGVAGERRYRVPSLPVPDLVALPPPGRLAESAEAVRLFLARARDWRPGFALTAQNARAVAEICARLDGIPLAIELAAARVDSLGAEGIAARLDDRFRLLTGGARDALPRQRTLRAALDWSYDLLSLPEQLLLDRLSVFAGGCTLAAAEAVCAGEGVGEWEVLDLLGSLVGKSLVQVEESGGEVRYTLLETVRQYGQERLAAAGTVGAVGDRHAAHFLALAEEAEPHLKGREQLDWLARLEVERDNLRAAMRRFAADGAAEEGLRLAAALYWFWYLRGGWAEHGAWLAQVLALSGAAAPGQARTKALGMAGLIALIQGEHAAGRSLMEEAIALGRQLDDRASTAWALLWLGTSDTRRDDPEARGRLEESLALYRGLGDQWGVVEALYELTRLAIRSGDLAAARALLDEGVALARREGERRHLALTQEVAGEVAYAMGDLAEAERLWAESLAQYTQMGDWLGIVQAEIWLGDLATRVGDTATARARYAASLAHQRGWRAGATAVMALAGLVAVAGLEGQAERVLRLAPAVLAARAAMGFHMPEMEERLERAVAAARATLGDRGAALWAAGEALTLAEAIAEALAETTAG